MSDIAIIFPDGTKLSVEEGATVRGATFVIDPDLGKDTVAGIVDSELVDKETPFHDGADLIIVTDQSGEYLDVLRHSAAYAFAQALQRLHPEAKPTIGPWADNGLYYDVTSADLEQENLEAIEDKVRDIIEEDLNIECVVIGREEALEKYADNPYKRNILEEEAVGNDELSFYQQGEFEDLCKGPHVESTGEIGAIKLLNISAAYWRGDENNDTLTWIYGTAFESESDLEEFLRMREEAKECDHRELGQELSLSTIGKTTGPDLPLYQPNGKHVLDELADYARQLNLDAGYNPVETPHLSRTELWKRSGHYEDYVDDMLLLDVSDEEYGLKPMNCPGRATVFDQQSWLYCDLPMHYFEDGKVYRKGQRGELSGPLRVQSFAIDGGHLFVRPDQIEDEISLIIDNILTVFDTFGLGAEIAPAMRPDKFVDSDKIQEQAETQLRTVLDDSGIGYDIEADDGTFYRPRVDFVFKDALDRKWSDPTVQLSFNMPDHFDLTYTGEDNEDHQPMMVHHALYSSYERFFIVLIEHSSDKSPFWLVPEQIHILPISGDQIRYAKKLQYELNDFHVDIEDRSWTLGRKIREAQTDRVPYMVIVSGGEEEDGTISVRDRKEREAKDVSVEVFRGRLQSEYDEKRTESNFLTDEKWGPTIGLGGS